ncbi:TetR family transcriptional regulator C-terminal domain-containing protein [Variovorax terrae]|uniref:TetR family transcriptional regulator C-terminal domain-containing protein n=1 Tax=Variovorax terrae TaxID=2923278 RepID=A0A9X1VYQ3_9BURK|nr:TetR family transcriptional regulator C-terminal domain-containing protein [Variovorax terrae]MCJ0764462.1 TetR family transcriptional regulator C-terminal domain-containing protein [Variovorax terrae]
MSHPNKVVSQAALRRLKLLEQVRRAAIEEFAQYGLRGASTQGIAQRAGLSKPSLHYYIESKEALYEEVLRATTRQWGQLIDQTDATMEPAQAIARLVRQKLEFAFDNPAVSRLFTKEVMDGATYIREYWAEWAQGRVKALELIQSWVDRGLIAPVDPLIFLFHIWAVTQHYADYESQVRYMMQREDGSLDRARITHEVTRLVLRGCGIEWQPPAEAKAPAAAPAAAPRSRATVRKPTATTAPARKTRKATG